MRMCAAVQQWSIDAVKWMRTSRICCVAFDAKLVYVCWDAMRQASTNLALLVHSPPNKDPQLRDTALTKLLVEHVCHPSAFELLNFSLPQVVHQKFCKFVLTQTLRFHLYHSQSCLQLLAR